MERELKNIPLSEVEVYFPKKAYDVLISFDIDNLYDLFNLYDNQKLYQLFFSKHKQARELWNIINGTINVLKCKYLGTDLCIDLYNNSRDFCEKIGLNRTVRKRIMCSKYLQLPLLFKMCESGDYSQLYFNFDATKTKEIIAKIQVLYEYKNKKEREYSNRELRDLQRYLETLVGEYNELISEIERVKLAISELNNKKAGVSKK